MPYYDRIGISEGCDVNKEVHQKSLMLDTVGISYIIVLNFNQIFVTVVRFCL